ncbi:hypothetical protein 16Q_151 [Pseudomonas phage 16Q]|nr:hypothetical protein 16Q_151 [Pseudomonas phage 16Q]
MTKFTGKHIVITTKEGEEFRFMGSAYTLSIDAFGDQIVRVRHDGDTVNWFLQSEVDSIVEDQFSQIFL